MMNVNYESGFWDIISEVINNNNKKNNYRAVIKCKFNKMIWNR